LHRCTLFILINEYRLFYQKKLNLVNKKVNSVA
jgi:hypothetical protein